MPQGCCDFSLSTGHFLIPPPPFTSKRICAALLFLTFQPEPKSLWGDQVSEARGMSLTLEPLADSLLAPRRYRLHARSPAAVARSLPGRPGRFLPVRAAGRRNSRSWIRVGRWGLALLPAGTGKSPPLCCQPIARRRQTRPGAKTPPPSLPGGTDTVLQP